MIRIHRSLLLSLGLTAGGAAAHALAGLGAGEPRGAAPQPGGPDIIVADIPELRTFGTLDGKTAFAFGTNACNIGDTPADWIQSTPEHPVIAQNMYRLRDGRFEQIGLSWLKHGFAALNAQYCGSCVATPSDSLGVGCSDIYSSVLNGSQGSLGPRSEVNAYTGVFPYPPGGTLPRTLLHRRLVVDNADLDPVLNPGARYFVEAHYVAADDAAAGNAWNNASHREIQVLGQDPNFTIQLLPGHRTVAKQPAIFAWQKIDPRVQIETVDVPGDGRLYVAHRVTQLGLRGWRYDYAIHNFSSHRSVRAFGVPLRDGVVVSDSTSRVPEHHSGEPYPARAWSTGLKSGHQYWAGISYAHNPQANVLRWGTVGTYGFVASSPPETVDGTIELFRPGSPECIAVPVVGPR